MFCKYKTFRDIRNTPARNFNRSDTNEQTSLPGYCAGITSPAATNVKGWATDEVEMVMSLS